VKEDAVKALRGLLIVVGVALVGGLLYLGAFRSRPQEDFFSGVVETTLWHLAFEVSGRLESFAVDEGRLVAAGAPLAGLHEADFQTALEAARAREGVAAAQLAALEAGSRPAEIRSAQARLDRAQAEFERLSSGATSEELDQARAQSEAAREAWKVRQQGFRTEDVQSAQAAVEAARSALEQARADARRYQELAREGAVSRRTREEFDNRLAQAQGHFDSALAVSQKLSRGYLPEEVEAAHQEYLAREARYRELARGTRQEMELVRQGPRAEDIQAARRRLREARSAVEQAELNLCKTRLAAPAEALVLTRNFEVGEMVQPGQPVLTLADLKKPWVEIFVPEPEIGQVHLGDAFDVTVDSAPGEVFPGRVSRIYEKAEYTPKTIQTQSQRVNLVYRVKITVQDEKGILKPGMPADARRRPTGSEAPADGR
jgi:multidrug resistance efflux pump